MLKTVDVPSLDLNNLQMQVEVDCEIRTDNDKGIIPFSMAHMKHTARKENPSQGTLARFPSKGKPGGKAGKHLAAHLAAQSQDDNNNVVAATVAAGHRR